MKDLPITLKPKIQILVKAVYLFDVQNVTDLELPSYNNHK